MALDRGLMEAHCDGRVERGDGTETRETSRTSNEGGSESEGPDTGVGFARGPRSTNDGGDRKTSDKRAIQTCPNE